jgi:DNA-binding MarR family transcriptional regulator
MSASDFPDSLAEVLGGIQRLIRRRLRRDLSTSRLRGAQIALIRLVADRPGIGVSAAAKELYLAGNSVSTLVNQLTTAGLLTRRTDPDDRRSARLLATPEALDRLRAWDERRSALVREQLSLLSEEDRGALEAALPALRRLAANLRDDVEGA